jgi:Leucine-rich repeat (LRR) protein
LKLTNLETLSIEGNKLSSLPPEILKLTNLETLNISHNYLTTLPAEI